LAVSRSYHAASAGNAARYCGIMGRSTYGDKPMRTSATLIAIAMSALASQAVLAQPAPPASPVHATCESKRAEIARDIEHAKAKGQSSRVRGLEKALRENQEHCSDAKLAQEHAAKIAAQERKVQERQRELDEAREKGKPARSQTVKPSWPRKGPNWKSCAEGISK
jgi:hypothetical protein